MCRRLRSRLWVRSLEARTAPAVFTVLNLNDSGADSLRQCVINANAAAGADTINFQAGLTGTITLNSGEIAISDALRINGLGSASTTISGGDISRIFNINSAAKGAAIVLEDMTLRDGKTTGSGGAIVGDDQLLTMNRCVLTSNRATSTLAGGAIAITDGGKFTANDCSMTSNTASAGSGGALAMFGGTGAEVYLTRCRISGNSAGAGGGVFVAGGLSITQCAVTSNRVTSGGGGGGIRATTANAPGYYVFILNSTLSDNTATFGGGIDLRFFDTGCFVRNSTVTGNSATTGAGGGIAVSAGTGSVYLESSVASGNIAASATDISSPNTVTQKFSAVGVGSGFTKTDLGNNLPFQAHANLKLSVLADNGGPTLSHLPLQGSPLIDAGSNPSALTVDQRDIGFPRAFAGLIDIGAVEGVSFLVSKTNDSGAGSLRQAVAHANAHPGADTVTFDATVFASLLSISLSTGELKITEQISVLGPASTVFISGNSASRAFFVSTGLGVGVPIVFENLYLIDCNASGSFGGAISIDDEALTLRNCTIVSSKALRGGAIDVGSLSVNAGSLLIEDCTINANVATGTSGTGGAIFVGNDINVTIRRSTISGNIAADSGGALYVFDDGSITIEDSTISGNTANSTHSQRGGGAIYFHGTATQILLKNSTISGNAAPTATGGGLCLVALSGPITVTNCTITRNSAGLNGGGIARHFGGGTFSISSTILAGNTNTNTPDAFFNSSTNIAGNNNLVGVADKGSFTLTGTGNLTGTLSSPLNPQLAALNMNGGPTMTHAFFSNSPALNAGNNSAMLVNDQRGAGFARVLGPSADIGALESESFTYLVTNANDSGAGSLRQALLDANVHVGGDVVIFDEAFFATPQTIKLTTGEINISGDVSITGPAGKVTISGNSASRIFAVSGAVPILMQNLNLTSAKGSAINTGSASLFLKSCTITNSTASSGGAILVSGGGVVIEDCVLSGNRANGFTFGNGGAIRALSNAAVTIRRCILTGNVAAGGGGAIYGYSGSLTIDNCTLSGNFAASGGAISMGSGAFTLENSTVSGNRANGSFGYAFGAGIDAGGTMTQFLISNSTISGNTSNASAGGIRANFTGPMTIRNSTVTTNYAYGSSGGVFLATTVTSSLSSSIIAGNKATTLPDFGSSAPVSVSGNNNLVGVAGDGSVTLTGTGNLTGTKTTPLIAMLGPLASNGGPTLTHALLTGSPAIDKGNNSAGLAFDQRGLSRVFGAGADIGALESQTQTLIVDILADENDGNFAKGDLSLREAVVIANNNPGVDTITFDPTVFFSTQAINLSLGEIAFSEAATVVGLGTGLVTINAKSASRVFSMKAAPNGSNFAISNLTVTGGSATTGGGIYGFTSNLDLNNCVISGNKATQLGAGVDTVGNLTATRCLITLNSGGASALRILGTTTLLDCTISGNTALHGAGLSVYGFLTVDSCTFSGNTATGTVGGGAIEQTSLLFSVFRNCTISGNSALSGNGGGVLFTHAGAFPDFQNCTITANSAASGGGIACQLGSGSIDLVSSIVSGNFAGVSADFFTPGTVNALVSLIGTDAGIATFTPDSFTMTNLGKSPMLAPLANNGGPTMTHALLPGSPAINNGSNPAALAFDQRGIGFARNVNGAVDIGAFEIQTLPAKITSVQINDGSAQRSRVTSLLVTFDQPPSLPGTPATAFELKRQSDNATVTLNAAPSGNTVTLTFTGGVPFELGSLADGRYTLKAFASQITNLDGDGNGTFGDDFVLVGDPATNKLFRLFGDADGDGTVPASDFIQFRLALGGNTAMFDFDGDGAVAASDFIQFRLRFGGSI